MTTPNGYKKENRSYIYLSHSITQKNTNIIMSDDSITNRTMKLYIKKKTYYFSDD
jgi:hypothetical protein